MASRTSSRSTSVSSSNTTSSTVSSRSSSSLNSIEYGLSKDDTYSLSPRRRSSDVTQVRYERLGRITAIEMQDGRQVFKVKGDFKKSSGIHPDAAVAKGCKVEYTLPLTAAIGFSGVLGPVKGGLMYTSTSTNEYLTEAELRCRRWALDRAQKRQSGQPKQKQMLASEKPNCQYVGYWSGTWRDWRSAGKLMCEIENRSGGYENLDFSDWQGPPPEGLGWPVYQNVDTGRYMTKETALKLGGKLDRSVNPLF